MSPSRAGRRNRKMQRTEPNPLAYFNKVTDAFRAAQAAAGTIERCYTIGGRLIRLSFAGPALIPHFAPALGHLAAAPANSLDLTICLWDSESTGVAIPTPP